MYYQTVFDFDDDDDNPRYRIRRQAGEDAIQDNAVLMIDPTLAEKNGIELDQHGFPTSESLEAWHRVHNSQHLFTK